MSQALQFLTYLNISATVQETLLPVIGHLALYPTRFVWNDVALYNTYNRDLYSFLLQCYEALPNSAHDWLTGGRWDLVALSWEEREERVVWTTLNTPKLCLGWRWVALLTGGVRPRDEYNQPQTALGRHKIFSRNSSSIKTSYRTGPYRWASVLRCFWRNKTWRHLYFNFQFYN